MKILFFCLFLIFLCCSVFAQTVTWEYNQSEEALIDGYKIYLKNGNNESEAILVPSPASREYDISNFNFTPIGNELYMTAFNGTTESPKSETIFYDPAKPKGLRIE